MGAQHSLARRTDIRANPQETDWRTGRTFQGSHHRRRSHEPGSGRILPPHQVPLHHRLRHDWMCPSHQLCSLEWIRPDFLRTGTRHHGSPYLQGKPGRQTRRNTSTWRERDDGLLQKPRSHQRSLHRRRMASHRRLGYTGRRQQPIHTRTQQDHDSQFQWTEYLPRRDRSTAQQHAFRPGKSCHRTE